MIRRPPRSPLFPYTPLSRSGAGEQQVRDVGAADEKEKSDRREQEQQDRPNPANEVLMQRRDANAHVLVVRSEEHTSELQSQSNLVCRLLLEKKKETKYDACA